MSNSTEICIEENNTFVKNLDLQVACPVFKDIGLDICQKDKDLPEDNKPVSLTLAYNFGTSINQAQDQESKKREVKTFGQDNDGTVFIRVLDKKGKAIFEGTVNAGEQFEVTNGGKKFDSETHVHIYDSQSAYNNNANAIQEIEFHTSCSQPLAIADTFGSIQLVGATLGGGAVLGGYSEFAPQDGLVYSIVGGADADLFEVNPQTGEVTFKSAPNFDTPLDQGANNIYDVTVRATAKGYPNKFTDEKLEIEVKDAEPICVEEDTTFVANLDLQVACPVFKDVGLDICQKDKDLPEDNKPVSLTLAYNFGTGINQAQDQESKKREVNTYGEDTDGTVFIRVLDKKDKVIFEGTVNAGEQFEVTNGGKKFDSETHVHIYDSQSAYNSNAKAIQEIEFHTSCSQPLAIADTFGSIQLVGATLGGGAVLGGYAEYAPADSLVYTIAGGADASLFEVDANTGEVNFINAPDFESPLDQGGNNVYDVIVRATAKGYPDKFTEEALEIEVKDVEPICIEENTQFVTNLDLEIECPVVKDVGIDLCQKDKDLPEDNKPVALTLTYDFGTTIDQVRDQESGKREVNTYGTDNDGTVFIRVLDKKDNVLFEGEVNAGEQFEVTNGGKKFDSETHVHIYDSESAFNSNAKAIQEIEFHTSCSQPLAIGDTFGSIQLSGATLGGGAVFGGSSTVIAPQSHLVYEIVGGDDEALFKVNPNNGVVSFINKPDFENPLDSNGDNLYNVTVRATLKEDPSKFVEETIEVEVKDKPEPGALSGTYFCDENRDNDDDGAAAGDKDVAGKLVTLLNADGSPAKDINGNTVSPVLTDEFGNYRFDNLAAGQYKVHFEATPNKQFITPNAGNNDRDDSDVNPNTGTTGIVNVYQNQETKDVDAGVAAPETASLAGRVWCDENQNDLEDAGEPGIGGVTVQLLAANNTVLATTTTNANGEYLFDNLDAGTYKVRFPTTIDGKTLVSKDVGNNDTIDSDAKQNNGRTDKISLAPGEHKKDVDAGVEDPGTASLAGRVWCDENQNDLEDGNEPGIGGVTVQLLAGNNTVLATTTTDANGEYLFDNLDAGTYKVRFPTAIDGKTLVSRNVGNDDTIDSDARKVNGKTSKITLDIGEHKKDVDAGVEDPGTSSLAGRVWCDENQNDLEDGSEPGIANVTVELLSADKGTVLATTTTDEDGNYLFDNLAAGNYQVRFPTAIDGKTLVAQNAGDDTIDSDANQNDGITDPVSLEIGEHKDDIDAGLVNDAPRAEDDCAETCYDIPTAVDVLANDTDPDGDSLTITHVAGQAITEGGPAIIDATTGVSISLIGGKLVFDGTTAHSDLLANETAVDTFSYQITDTAGNTASANVQVTFKGATDTLEKVAETLPDSVKFRLSSSYVAGTDAPETAFDMVLMGSSKPDFDGLFEHAYCVSYLDSIPAVNSPSIINTAMVVTGNLYLADQTVLENAGISLGVDKFGNDAMENLDLINWILNQDFTNADNGDGTGETFTDAEIQGAIWALTDGELIQSFGDNPAYAYEDGVIVPVAGGTIENANDILEFALANGEGFEAGEGDLVGVFIEPTHPASAQQPFIVGLDLFEECIC